MIIDDKKNDILFISVEPNDESVELPIGEVTLKEVMNIENSEKFRIGTLNIQNDFSDESDILNMMVKSSIDLITIENTSWQYIA